MRISNARMNNVSWIHAGVWMLVMLCYGMEKQANISSDGENMEVIQLYSSIILIKSYGDWMA